MREIDGSNISNSNQNNTTAVSIASLLIPGIGQLLNSEVGKGLGMLALWIVFYFVWPPLMLVLCFLSSWDAYEGSKKLCLQGEWDAQVLARNAEEQISAKDMVGQIEKLNNLAEAKLLTAEEFSDRKSKVIRILANKRPTDSAEDFLIALIPLVKSGSITDEEITQIKSLLLR